LVEQFEKYYVFRDLKNTIVYQQAKEMEKEQMIDFGNDLLAQNDINYTGVLNLAEQYYNETYRNNK